VVDSFDWTTPRTKDAVALLAALGADGKALVVMDRVDDIAGVAFRNLPQIVVSEPGQLTAYDVLWAKHLIFTSHTVGAVGGAGAYDISKSDFVREAVS
jgi:large subunit ribosomal protein L4